MHAYMDVHRLVYAQICLYVYVYIYIYIHGRYIHICAKAYSFRKVHFLMQRSSPRYNARLTRTRCGSGRRAGLGTQVGRTNKASEMKMRNLSEATTLS